MRGESRAIPEVADDNDASHSLGRWSPAYGKKISVLEENDNTNHFDRNAAEDGRERERDGGPWSSESCSDAESQIADADAPS